MTLKDIKQNLIKLIYNKSDVLTYGDFTLSSGQKSGYYLDCRKITLDPTGLSYICNLLIPTLIDSDVDYIGGPVIGADPIVSGLSLMSCHNVKQLPAFLVRNNKKGHGKGNVIEGNLKPNSKVAIIDDVCTTGKSILYAIKRVEELGCMIEKVMVVINREDSDGWIKIRDKGYKFEPIITVREGFLK